MWFPGPFFPFDPNILLRHSENLGKQIEGDRGKYARVREKNMYQPLSHYDGFSHYVITSGLYTGYLRRIKVLLCDTYL